MEKADTSVSTEPTLTANSTAKISPFGSFFGFSGVKKRGHGSRSWIKIDQYGNEKVLELDKATIMRHCSLPSRDLRLLDPLFIYPSTILGREKAIVVNLEQIRCIITSDEVFVMNSLDGSDFPDILPFEFKALELTLELTCTSLDAQRVQKVRDEIEHLMDDDGDMAEMYLTEKKENMGDDMSYDSDIEKEDIVLPAVKWLSKSAPVSPVTPVSPAAPTNGLHKLQRAYSSITRSSKHASLSTSSSQREDIVQLEMLLEAYFVFIDHTLSKLSSLKEYIDDTEDLINIKLGNVQNQLIQFELLLTAATFVATIFTVVAGVFGMNFQASVFNNPFTFHWVLLISSISCGILYFCFLLYFRKKKVFPV